MEWKFIHASYCCRLNICRNEPILNRWYSYLTSYWHIFCKNCFLLIPFTMQLSFNKCIIYIIFVALKEALLFSSLIFNLNQLLIYAGNNYTNKSVKRPKSSYRKVAVNHTFMLLIIDHWPNFFFPLNTKFGQWFLR